MDRGLMTPGNHRTKFQIFYRIIVVFFLKTSKIYRFACPTSFETIWHPSKIYVEKLGYRPPKIVCIYKI